MDHLAEEFVRCSKEQGLGGRGRRYPERLRHVAVRYGRWALDSGVELGAAAKALGISALTLGRWLERETLTSEAPVMHEVTVVGEALPTGELAVCTPDGFRIEGVARSELASVLAVLRG